MLNSASTSFPILTTRRLTLRPLLMGDDQEIFILRSDPEINKYLNRQPANGIAAARNFISDISQNISGRNCLYWAITLNDENKLVGTICLFGFSAENKACEIGYELLSNNQGQGIMSESIEKVIEYAFQCLGVQKIEAFLHQDNQPSIKLLEKFLFGKVDKTDQTNPELIYYALVNSSVEEG